MSLSRRNFMKAGLSSLAYFTTASTVPLWLSKSANAVAKDLKGDRILVIVQLAGGNDGLNTVIPYTDPLYNGSTLRPTLHIVSGLGPTTLDDKNALHPKLIRLKNWYSDGKVAVINNVGYPNPNLSHFSSTDYWELGSSPGAAASFTEGWITRYFDNQCAGTPPDSINPLTMLGAGQYTVPLTLRGSALYTPPAVPDFYSYYIQFPDGDYGDFVKAYMEALNHTTPLNSSVDFVQRSANLAQASIVDIENARNLPTLNPYPDGQLGVGLDIASKIIRGGFPTRIFYVTQDGYDTHANQVEGNDPANQGAHPLLFDEFDQAINAFLSDMAQANMLSKVALMTFSEFGRRVEENGSGGTDHGTASCLFVMGGGVTSGVYGGQPDLENLDNENLRHNVDFRSVYARVLKDWLQVNPEPIFGAADYADPTFHIRTGMNTIPIFDPPAPGADVNKDGAVDAVDVQLVINGALGIPVEGSTDINNDGVTDAVDVQREINAALAKRGKSERNTVPPTTPKRTRGKTLTRPIARSTRFLPRPPRIPA